jgi:hypothetical protein
LPVAVVPLWHDAQLPLTWVWSTRMTGRQFVVEWQPSHVMVDWMCVVLLPVAFTPSWQPAQPAVTPECEKLAGFHAAVTWQASQVSLEPMCPGFLPVAVVPLWQEKQAPCTCVWSTRVAGFHVAVAWHDSQLGEVVMCAAFLPAALVPLWQLAQSWTMPACVNDEGFHAVVV